MAKVRKITVLFTIFILCTSVIGAVSVSAASKKKAEKTVKYAVTIDVSKAPYNVKDGDDCTKAVQSALDEAASKGTAEEPGLVTIPKGTYYINRNLIIGSNTTLSLDKKTVIKKVDDRRFPRMLRTPEETENTPKGFAAYSNITVTGGTWDNEFKVTEADPTTSGSIFFMVHVTGLTIKDVTACNIYGTHIFEFGGVKDVNISGCKLYGFKAETELIEKEAIQLDVTHDDQILPSGGPFDDTPCENVTITDCEIYDYPRAVGSHIAIDGIYHKNIVISGNNFHDCKGAAVYGYNYIAMTVSDNKMTNVGTGIVMRNCAMGGAASYYDRLEGVKGSKVKNNDFAMVISGNTIVTIDPTAVPPLSTAASKNSNKADTSKKDSKAEGSDAFDDDFDDSSEVADGVEEPEDEDTTGDAKGIMIYGIKERPISNVTIKNNKITATSSGIFLYYVQNSTVSGNTVLRNKGAQDTLKTMYMEDGLKINECTKVDITKNKISTTAGTGFENGIAIRGGKTNTIKSNTVSEASKNCVAVYGSKVTGSGNTFKGSQKNGITVSLGGSLTLSKDDKISSVKAHGISVTGKSSVKLTGTSVADVGGMGIYLGEDSKLTAESVTVKNAGSHGICANSGSATVNKCTVTGADGNGVTVTGKASVTVKGKTTIKNSGQTGISVSGGATLSANSVTVSGSGNQGVGVYEKGSSASLNTVTIEKSTNHGIYTSEGKTTVKGGSVSGSGRNNITAESEASVTLSGDLSIASAVDSGISVTDTVLSVTGCKITGNGKYGAGLFGSTSAQMNDTSISGSGSYGICADRDTVLTGKNVTVNESGSYGLLAKDNAKVNLTKITITKSGYGATDKTNAVVVLRAASAELSSFKLDDATGSGVSVTGGKVVLKDGSIAKSGKNGIGVYEGGEAELSGVKIKESAEYGVFAGAGTSVRIKDGSEIRDTGKDGVMIAGKNHTALEGEVKAKDGAKFEMTGSKVIGAQKKGICLKEGVDAVITDTVVSDCPNDHGIYVTDSDTTLFVNSCEISRNGTFNSISKSGILAENNCMLKVRGSAFEQNSNYGISAKNARTDITYDNSFSGNGAAKQYIY